MYEFKKQLKLLSKFSGKGTELISVYITPGYAISEISGKLRDEFGQAANIKSKSTQKNVQAALEKAMHHLKTLGHKAPGNGIAIFAGNVSEKEGKPDVRLFSLSPPLPLQTQFYRCESKFVLEPLEEMMDSAGSYGLVVMDGKDATVAILKGKTTKVIKRLHSTAHQKVVKGGQSAARYDRIVDEEIDVYYKRISEAMDAFVGLKNFKGVIIGGPGPAKENFEKAKHFNYQLKVLGVVDTGYTDEFGLREVLEKSANIISDQESVVEKRIVDQFMKEIAHGGLATYGIDEVKSALEMNKVSKLLISEGFELHELQLKCPNCGNAETATVETKTDEPLDANTSNCRKCNARMQVISDKDLITELSDKSMTEGVEILMISQETPEGEQFFATFHGLGAFLRYK